MEGEDNDVGLSDIIDVLNTLDNPPNGEQYDASANSQQLPKKVPQELASPSSSTTSSSSSKKPKPYIKIVEQPAPKALRFRYKCEGRSAGSIPGVNSTPENKTFPTIEIVGHTGGDVIIVVSCVTKDAPYRPHPHNIVGKDEKSCSNGICTLTISGNPARAVFSNLGIQCVKKKDIKAALDVRENLKVDPFKTKFAHKDQPSSIDLNAVRLCFQAYHRTPDGVKSLAKAVVTEPIYDKKGIYELTICRLCSCSAKVGGGDEIILLCEKFSKDDIKIRFFELNAEGNVIWEDFGEFQATDIHKQNAIAFKTPRYHNVEISEKAKVFIQLVRPSDQECSEPLPFEFHPDTGMRAFPRLHRKLKRKQDLEIFQQILSVDSDIGAAKYACPPSEPLDSGGENDIEASEPSCSLEESTKSNPLSSDTINDYDKADRRRSESETDGGVGDDINEGSMDRLHDTDIEMEVPLIVYPSGADEATQTSTPLEDFLKQQHDYDAPHVISPSDKIAEWMRSSEFERTDSLNVENGDANSITPATAYTNIENTSSSFNATLSTGTDYDVDGFNDMLEQVEEQEAELARERVLHHDEMVERKQSSHVVDPHELPESLRDLTIGPGASASNQASVEMDESFDDNATYTSLQIAYKNPIEIPLSLLRDLQNAKESKSPPGTSSTFETSSFQRYPEDTEPEDLVVLTNPPAPKIKVNSSPTPLSPPPPPPRTPSPVSDQAQRPPLPPKRIRSPSEIALSSEHRSSDPGPNTSLQLHSNGSSPSPRPQSQIIIMRTPDQSPTKRRPHTPPSASPKKKQGFFSRLFTRGKNKSDPNSSPNDLTSSSKNNSNASSREPSIGNFSLLDANRSSVRSVKSNASSLRPHNGTLNDSTSERSGKPVARSSSSTSGKRPAYLDADVIHIPLKGGDSMNSLSPQPPNSGGAYSSCSTITLGNQLDRRTLSALQLADIPINDGKMELVAIADRQSIRNLCEGAFNVQLDPSVDLSEAEHFALYTSIPQGDDVEHMSYYEQIEAGLLLSADDVARRLAEANGL